jgi:hexosaminidase
MLRLASLALTVRSGGTPPAGEVLELRRDRALAGALGTEGYRLSVRTGRAADDAGLFYAVRTMRQLLPPAVFREAPMPGVAWTMPAVEIEDVPRFTWRATSCPRSSPRST